jgi:hypothetical protein
MSKFDAEREVLGLSSKKGKAGQSKFAAQRELMKYPPKPVYDPQAVEAERKSRAAASKERAKETFDDGKVGGVDVAYNLLPISSKDNLLAKLGKGAVNYGAGVVGRTLSAPGQLLMNVSDNTARVIEGRPLNIGEKSFVSDILPSGASKAIGNIKSPVLKSFVTSGLETLADPTTYIGGGIVDDLAKAGIVGKAAKTGTTENLIATANRNLKNTKAIPKQAVKETVEEVAAPKPIPQPLKQEPVTQVKVTTPKNRIEGQKEIFEPIEQKVVKVSTPMKGSAAKKADVPVQPTNSKFGFSKEEKEVALKQLNDDAEEIIQQQVNYLKATHGKKPLPGNLIRDEQGNVIGRQGRVSQNEKWYQEYHKEYKKKPSQKELREIAINQLENGFESNDGNIPANEEFMGLKSLINDISQDSISSAKELPPPRQFTPTEILQQGKVKKLMPDVKFENGEMVKTTNVLEPKTPYQKKFVDDYMATLPDDEAELGNLITQLESKAKTTLDQEELVKINLQAFAAKQKKNSFKSNFTDAEIADFESGAKPLPKSSVDIEMEKAKEKMSFGDTIKKFYNRIVDSQSASNKVTKLSGSDDVKVLASNSRNAGGKVDFMFTKGLTDQQGKVIGKSLQEVAEKIPKGKEKDFWTYMSHRHNIDRAFEGKNIHPDYTPTMSERAVKEWEAANPSFKEAGNDVVKWIDDFMREWGVSTGLVDKDLYDELRTMYKNYFPTQRSFSQLEKNMPETIRNKFADLASPIQKAKISDKNLQNPLENIMNLVNRTVRTAEYNKVGQSLLDSIRQQPNKLKAIGEVIPTQQGMFANTDNVISVLENGKPVYIKVNDKDVLDFMNGLPKNINNLKVLRNATNIFKQLITQKNPLFAVRNIFRDIPTAYVYGSENNPLKFARNLGKATKEILTDSGGYKQYQALGGASSQFFNSSNANKAAQSLTKKGFHPLKAIEKLNSLTEAAPRVAEFNKVLETTGDINKAMYAANNVTVNFARGGDVTKTMEAFVPYLNAGVQGLDKFFSSFKDPKTAFKTIAKAGGIITIPEVALYLINKDDPNYQALDNRTKDTYFLIPDGKGEFYKIPKSRELGVLFGSLFQRALRAADGDKEGFKGFGTTVATSFAPANPIEDNILAPATLNLAANKDFAGRPIVPLGMLMNKRSRYLQYDETTSEIAKKIGELAAKATGGQGWSPKQIDYLIKSYTGVIGQFGLPLTTKGADAIKPLKTAFKSDPLYSNQYVQNFYDNLDKLQTQASDKNIIEKIDSKKVTDVEVLKNKFLKTSKEMSMLGDISLRFQAGSMTTDDKETLKKLSINPYSKRDEVLRAIKKQQVTLAEQANKLIGKGGQR